MLILQINDTAINLDHLDEYKICDVRENIFTHIYEVSKELLNRSHYKISIKYEDEILSYADVEMPYFQLNSDLNLIDINVIVDSIKDILLRSDNYAYYTDDDDMDRNNEMLKNGEVLFPNLSVAERKTKELEVYYELESRVNKRYYRNLRINGWTIILEWCK